MRSEIKLSIRNNPLNTDKQKFRFKKKVLNAVDDYLKYILSDFTAMHTELSKKSGRRKLK
jgi:hypothetical protein|tara:strand:- start:165 stop:344 length:180 start_codon:yes stop_codon:yes gene_type:complete